MLTIRKLSLVFLLLFCSLAVAAQVNVIRVSDPVKNKTRIIREGDRLRIFAFSDSAFHEGRITYIGEKGVQVEGHTYQLNEIRLVSYNSHRREVTMDVAGFAGETFMMAGGFVMRIGTEIAASGEKAAVVVGLPMMGIGGAVWLTGLIAREIVFPVLAANDTRVIHENSQAEFTSGKTRRHASKAGDDVYNQD